MCVTHCQLPPVRVLVARHDFGFKTRSGRDARRDARLDAIGIKDGAKQRTIPRPLFLTAIVHMEPAVRRRATCLWALH